MPYVARLYTGIFLALTGLLLAPAAFAQPAAPDTLRAGRYDQGKMWTFEDPPIDYLAEQYGFRPDAAWFERARLGALRLSGCSAAFVSPNGLIATNHHCAKSAVAQVSRSGEALLDNGFYAPTQADERSVSNFYADQLIALADVTSEIDAALAGVAEEARGEAREAAFEQVQQRLREAYQVAADSLVVQVVSLYDGGRYSAYVFRRYTNLRLVMAPEVQLGSFGGDADNFTYPRYSLDFAFLRVYDADGQPLRSAHYFPWSREGVAPGDAVFVIGNPGSTDRLNSFAQLTYLRDVHTPLLLDFYTSRVAAQEAYLATGLDETASANTRNTISTLANGQKAYQGMVQALQDTIILARRYDAERQFREALSADPALDAAYHDLHQRLEAVNQEKLDLADETRAFLLLSNATYASATLRRALYAFIYLVQQQNGASADELDNLRQALLAISDHPPVVEQHYLKTRLEWFARAFGPDDALVQAILQGQTPEAAAARLLDASSLATAAGTAEAMERGTLSIADPAVQAAQAFGPRYLEWERAYAEVNAREDALAGQLGRARFDVYGTAVPPDATFSPRITDGVVQGYRYNGTLAPPFTTYYGLYNHYHSYGTGTAWDLPARWQHPPATFDLSTPVNFASTADTIGGNSGSPVVNRRLELVGLNFDRNIEGLSRNYIYLPSRARNIAVDARGIQEALTEIYDADRLVDELTTGQLIP